MLKYLLLPALIVASDVTNTGQNTRDVSRPQRRQQRVKIIVKHVHRQEKKCNQIEIGFQKTRVTTTTTTTATVPIERPSDRAIGSDFVPRDIIKFELADAKVPDFATQQRYKPQQANNKRPRQRKARRQESVTSTEAIETINNDKPISTGDQSGSDTRGILSISHPAPVTPFDSQRMKTVKQLPFSVQKAINHAMKQDFQIPFLDTIKYYFKDPTPKTKQFIGVDRLPAGAKLVSDSRIRQWWQPPPNFKTASVGFAKVSPTTLKPLGSSNDYVAYPLLRSYPVQYSMNVASDLVNGVGFLYGDRIYSKPYTYQKNVNQFTGDVKPVIEQKPFGDDDIVNGVYRTTQNSILSTSPVVFPTSTELPKTQTFVKYYSAELPERIPTDPDTGVPLSNDKNTINLINRAVSDLKKHNPHLNVVPKRLEKDELVVHVTPRPEYLSPLSGIKSTTVIPGFSSTTAQSFINHSEKKFLGDKNLVYLNKVIGSNKVKPHIAGHAYVTHIEPSNYDDLVILQLSSIMFHYIC